MFLILLTWGNFIINMKNLKNPFHKTTSTIYLFFPFLLSIYYTRSQWYSFLQPVLTSGPGPDVAQNLMAGQHADKIGSTWSQASANLMESLNVNDVASAYSRIFELPSFKETATYEYMVVGLRWGLSVPMNQLTKFLGPQITILEVGIVLMTTLISLSIIFMACSKLILKNNYLPTVITIILISNTAMLYQYFLGGLSQVFGSIGIAGILLTLVLFFKLHEDKPTDYNKRSIFLLSTFSWVGLIVSYLQSAFIIIAVLFSFFFIAIILNRKVFKSALSIILGPIVMSFILNPFLTYIIILTSGNQSANLQTGYKSGIWQTPTQLIGLLTIYPPANRVIPSYSDVIIPLSVFITLILLLFVVITAVNSHRNPNLLAFFVLTIFLINIGAFLISYFGVLNSDYIYNKVNVYLSPLLMFTLLVLLINHRPLLRFREFLISSILVLVLIPAIHFTEKFSSPTESIKIPYQYGSLLKDASVLKYLNSKNFIQPYKMAYDFSGLFGAEYSVSRAPNSANLSARMDNELMILCFTGDPDCKPRTPKIPNLILDNYGISLFVSELTTSEFAKLSAKDRYQYNFDSLGWVGFDINDRFLGGNPYFN